MRRWLRLTLVVAAGCGRIGFDATVAPPAHDAAGGDAAAAVPTSCAALADACGPARDESCCASPTVPAGSYDRGFDVGSDGAFPDASHPATVSAFRLDRFEITVGRFRAFVDAGKGTRQDPPAPGDGAHPQIASSGWDATWDADLLATPAALGSALSCDSNATWTPAPGANETRPINCITWYEAMAFCAWDGGFLPTEAEWNAAAAGEDQQRAFPWSSPASSVAIDCAHADYAPGGTACVSTAIAAEPVGSRSPAGDGRYGQADLAGNVWEQVLDAFGSAYAVPCDDCAALSATATARVLRGGGAHDGAITVRGAGRTSLSPVDRMAHVNQGARCARAP